MEFEGYCVKCREKRTVEKGELKDTPNGRQMAQGKCPVCGTTVTRFMAGGGGGNSSESGGGAKSGGAKASAGAKSGSGSKSKAGESGSGKSSRSSK